MHSYYGYIFNNLCPLFQHMKFSPVSPGWHFCLFSGIVPGFPLHLYLWPCADHFKIYLYRVCLSTFSVLLKLLAVQNYFKTVWCSCASEPPRTYNHNLYICVVAGLILAPAFTEDMSLCITPSFCNELNPQHRLQVFDLCSFYPER